MWLSSRDLGTLHQLDLANWKIAGEVDPPGIVWAAVAGNGRMYFTLGKGLNDDRFVYRYAPDEGFLKMFACPDYTGSYLSYNDGTLYFSQWYTGDIHQVNDAGNIVRTMNVEAEICGHTFVDGSIFVIRGKENKGLPNKSEEWRIARLDPREKTPKIEDLAIVPFAARSLAFDGKKFWSNHRAAGETMSFTLPR